MAETTTTHQPDYAFCDKGTCLFASCTPDCKEHPEHVPEFTIEFSYSGHLSADSESDGYCGTCDGVRCEPEVDTCRKIWTVYDKDGEFVSRHTDHDEAKKVAGTYEPPVVEPTEEELKAEKANHYQEIKSLMAHIRSQLKTPEKYNAQYRRSLEEAKSALGTLRRFW